MPSDHTEDQLVQKTTAEYLEQQLGWESVYAYNTETCGLEGTLGRASDRVGSGGRKRSGRVPSGRSLAITGLVITPGSLRRTGNSASMKIHRSWRPRRHEREDTS